MLGALLGLGMLLLLLRLLGTLLRLSVLLQAAAKALSTLLWLGVLLRGLRWSLGALRLGGMLLLLRSGLRALLLRLGMLLRC